LELPDALFAVMLAACGHLKINSSVKFGALAISLPGWFGMAVPIVLAWCQTSLLTGPKTLEAQAVSTRAATLSGVQDNQRTKDGVATAAAIVIFWPAAFFVGGDKQTAAELAQMKGQIVAIEQASIAKKCNIQFQGRPEGS
jgi:hypothetical protein